MKRRTWDNVYLREDAWGKVTSLENGRRGI